MNATHISGACIDCYVEFAWNFPGSDVEATVRGEIREIHHNPEGVTIWLANPDGNGDKTGFTIAAGTKVKIIDN